MDAIGISICEVSYYRLNFCISDGLPPTSYLSLLFCIDSGIWYVNQDVICDVERCNADISFLINLPYQTGLTETSPVIAINVLSRRKAGSVGKVLSGVDVWIVDPEGNALGPGEEGEICCR